MIRPVQSAVPEEMPAVAPPAAPFFHRYRVLSILNAAAYPRWDRLRRLFARVRISPAWRGCRYRRELDPNLLGTTGRPERARTRRERSTPSSWGLASSRMRPIAWRLRTAAKECPAGTGGGSESWPTPFHEPGWVLCVPPRDSQKVLVLD
jgi:hypothetical protein